MFRFSDLHKLRSAGRLKWGGKKCIHLNRLDASPLLWLSQSEPTKTCTHTKVNSALCSLGLGV